ncbi:MAG: cytochrome b N-terminal domain-containing protein [Verrucomicrobia bacterium]|nr:cytochrome b N-terminal domain-containing protein [Verrucomicrobiota bacterium]
MIQVFRNIAVWLDDRLQLTKLWEQTAGHEIPKSSGSWFYALGSMTLTCFAVQIVTGILLAFVYTPSAAEAYRSLEYLNYQEFLGWFLRALHYWGSMCMVILMMLHMTQVFLWGAYKYPRELTWISGVVLMVLTLGMAFTGQVMRFDADAYWGLGIGVAIMGRIPLIGAQAIDLLLGGPILGTATLSRFFALHVFIIPGLLIALISMHLRLVLGKGINEYPKPGVVVKRATYDKYYHALLKKEGIPFVPDGIDKDVVATAILLIVLFALSAIFGPKGPGTPADPTQVISDAKPDFPFLWIFAAAALAPFGWEIALFFVMPTIVGLLLFGLPFISNEGEKHWSRRPVAVMIVVLTFLGLGVLTYEGLTGPWSPHMDAWRAQASRPEFLKDRGALELAGATVFQNKQCRNCHAIGGEGGVRGPDLSAIGTRMTEPQLVRQIIQGGGNMPAYAQNVSPDEIRALVAYLTSLRPRNEVPAQNPAGPENKPRDQQSGQGMAELSEKESLVSSTK